MPDWRFRPEGVTYWRFSLEGGIYWRFSPEGGITLPVASATGLAETNQLARRAAREGMIYSAYEIFSLRREFHCEIHCAADKADRCVALRAY